MVRRIRAGALATAFALLWALSLASPALAERVALVIGNAAYTHAPPLVNPKNDAQDVAGALRRIGFDHVETLYDGSREAMALALINFYQRAAQAEIALVYFAGHGVEVAGRNYLIPTEAEMQNSAAAQFQAIALDDVLDATAGASKLRLVIVDACRENPFTRRMRGAGGTRSIGRGLRSVEPRENVLVAYSAEGGSLANDGTGRNSPYAAALLQTLQEPPRDVRLLFGRVRDRVVSATKGLTFPQKPFLYGSLGGDEVLLHKSATRPAPPPPPRTSPSAGGGDAIVVDPSGRGDHRTIAEAIKAAKPGATIRIRPGRYTEALKVTKPLELIGDGARATIVLEARDAFVIAWTAPSGRISGLTMRQLGPPDSGKGYGAVHFSNGSAVLENSDMTSADGTIVFVRGNAAPTIRNNRIHGGAHAGVAFFDNAKGVLEDNEIYGNTISGVATFKGADPIVRRNAIRDNKESGVYVYDEGAGVYEDNRITGNGFSGVSVRSDGAPTVRRNAITGSKRHGVQITDGRGTFTENTIQDNSMGAWLITKEAGEVFREGNTE